MPSGGAISRQGSLCSLTLSDVEGQLHGVNLDDLLRTAGSARKTADEVWRDIQGGTQMTLEDYLSRPGADAGGAHWAEQYNPAAPVPGQQRHTNVGRPLPRPLGVGAGPVLDALYHDHDHDHDGATMSGRKRAAAGGPGEKTVERRKKRMIKNRESAARSRARKQAYTNELENKISRLEEENQQLRSYKAFEPVVHCVPQQEPKNQLRRRNSASF
ncbi:ABSCISIC ACID-INSENSITIVE 5-like protein 2 [Hordeum vulgare]|nr:ABSCISIC ACID-INSENSITIVE 5-like protein 2 [Hordeum vulgare]